MQLSTSEVFSDIVAYPRRYFDDLVIDQYKVLKHTESNMMSGLET